MSRSLRAEQRLRRRLFGWAVLVCACATPACAQPLVDASRTMAAQQARMGSNPGTVVLDAPSHLHGEVWLKRGQGLRVLAPLSLEGAVIHLAGGNDVRCQAPITALNQGDLFVAEDASGISVRGCDVTVNGRGGGSLLTATRSDHVIATDNHLRNMALFTTHNVGGEKSRTTDVSLSGNSVEFTREVGPIGVYLMYVLRATVSNNRFRGTGHGIEWWGGDGNIGWQGTGAVTQAGNMTITGNQCSAAGGACVWGSMGFNIVVSGNSAESCGDVCFDSEGGVRNLFTGNVAEACGAGCYSVQMESEDVVFSGNYAYADRKKPALALFLIKHRNGNPATHHNLTITGNTLTCGDVCTAFYGEGEGGLNLANNTVVNGRLVFVNYDRDVRIAGNSLVFHLPLGGKPAIEAPSMANGQASVIEGNELRADVAEPGSVCIAQSWSDFNSTDSMRIAGNTCTNFGTGVVTETAGKNPGAPRAIWTITGNRFVNVADPAQVVHRHTSGNESYAAP